MESIEWERSFADSRGARLFAYVFLGLFLGLGLIIGVLLVAAVPLIVVSLLDDPAMLAVVALLALVGGPMSLLYLWPLLTDPEQRKGIAVASWPAELSRAGVVVAVALGAAVHVASLWVFRMGPHLLLVVGGVVGALGVNVLLTAGRIDPDERTISVRSNHWADGTDMRTVDLDGWADLHRYRVGPVVVLRPSYARGATASRPRLLTVPAWVAGAAEPVFEDALAGPTPERERESNPTVAATLVVFGIGSAGVGLALGLVDAVPAGFRAWFAAVFGLFGAIFFAAAWRER